MTRTRLLLATLSLAVLGAAAGCSRLRGPVKVGTLLPLVGPEAATGMVLRNAMQLAVDQANQAGGIQGRRVELVALDEGRSVEETRAAAARLGADRAILGTVPHYLDQNGLATNDTFHTHGALANLLVGVINTDALDHVGRMPERFRVIAPVRYLEKQAARYAFEQLKARRFYVVYEPDPEANHAAITFSEEAAEQESDHKENVRLEPLPAGMTAWEGFANIVKAVGTDYFFYAGSDEGAARCLHALRAAGVAVPFQLANKLPSPRFLELAGSDAEGTLFSFIDPPPEQTAAGRAFLADYAAAGFKEPAGHPYAFAAYVSTKVMLEAIARSSLERDSVVGALQHGHFKTAFGPLVFDTWGQMLHPLATLYRVSGGRWQPIAVSGPDEKLVPFAPGN